MSSGLGRMNSRPDRDQWPAGSLQIPAAALQRNGQQIYFNGIRDEVV
jgi:hypothetical protein